MPDPILYNLLDEPLFGVEDDAGASARVSLPDLLARLSRGESVSLTAVQAHQQHAVHAFLVQLAALALARAEETEIAHDEANWRRLLVACANVDGAGPEAFALVVTDLSKPAFMQPPVPEGTIEILHNDHATPSAELDVLVTSKNHDVKVDRIGRPTAEHWTLALMTLQTMQGFLGAGNYGIARMNGGFASRPCITFAPDFAASRRFRRDVAQLLQKRATLQERFGFASRGHHGLTWCVPWDGTTSLTLPELDPFFIEVCRRVRLASAPAGIHARRGTSTAPRIEAKDAKGNLGDPWTPVARKDGKALTVAESGFTYQRVQALLAGEDWEHGPAGHPGAGDRLWLGQVLVRGQGTTGGYHERWLMVPERVRSLLARPEGRAALAARAQEWVEKADTASRRILRPALLTLMQGGPDGDLKFDDRRADGYLRRLDATVDREFFPLLFEHAESPPEIADAQFEQRLFDLARTQMAAAISSLPVPSARRWRAEARAWGVFRGASRKHLKGALPISNKHEESCATPGDTP